MKEKYEIPGLKCAIVDILNAKDYMEEFRGEFSGTSSWLELYTIYKIYKLLCNASDLLENCDNLVKEFRVRNREEK